MEPWAAFATALGITLVAEFGDKTQFAVLALASKGSPGRVWIGATAAFFVLSLAGAWVGMLVGDRLPLRWVAFAAGLVFIGLGLWGLRPEREETQRIGGHAGLWSSFGLVALAELGDRSQLAVVALAAREGHPWAIGLGAGAGMAVATLGSVALGHFLRGRIPERPLRLLGAAVFLVVGVAFVAATFL